MAVFAAVRGEHVNRTVGQVVPNLKVWNVLCPRLACVGLFTWLLSCPRCCVDVTCLQSLRLLIFFLASVMSG